MDTRFWLSMHSRNLIAKKSSVCLSLRLSFHVSACEMSNLLAWSPTHIQPLFTLILDLHVMVN